MDAQADPDFRLDADGICNYCRTGDAGVATLPTEADGDDRLLPVVEALKAKGKGREYDAIVGLSGGVDSSTVARIASRHGIRALAVHFDNGWNSELAVENIQRVVEDCGYDLMTYVIDWPEFRDIQRAFLKASVIDLELITDHAILAALIRLADEHDIPVILSGNNRATEHGMPQTWVWDKHDRTNIKAIHDRFGTIPLKSFPHLTRRRWLAIRAGRRPQIVGPLDLVRYRRDRAANALETEIGWREYGGKHHESTITKFYQSWILPTKWGIDKRKVHLSARLRNGELTRAEALVELEKPLYTPEALATERAFVLKKLGFSESEFDEIMATPPKPHDAYPTDHVAVDLMRRIYRPVKALAKRQAVS
jgi:N-acetyl sugar amidotransferase